MEFGSSQKVFIFTAKMKMQRNYIYFFARLVGSRLVFVFSSSFCALYFIVYSSVCSYPACRLWDMKPNPELSYFIVKNNTKRPNAKWWNITEKGGKTMGKVCYGKMYVCVNDIICINKTSSGKSQEGKGMFNSASLRMMEYMWKIRLDGIYLKECGASQSISYL